MPLFIVPAWLLSLMALLGAALCLYNVAWMTRRPMWFAAQRWLAAGLALVTPSLLALAVLYYTFANWQVDIELRQAWIRLDLAVFLLVLDVGLLILAVRGKREP